jgi:hypothetical protein
MSLDQTLLLEERWVSLNTKLGMYRKWWSCTIILWVMLFSLSNPSATKDYFSHLCDELQGSWFRRFAMLAAKQKSYDGKQRLARPSSWTSCMTMSDGRVCRKQNHPKWKMMPTIDFQLLKRRVSEQNAEKSDQLGKSESISCHGGLDACAVLRVFKIEMRKGEADTTLT